MKSLHTDQIRFCSKIFNFSFPYFTCILQFCQKQIKKIKQVRRPCRSSQRLTLLLSVHNQNCSWWNICCTSLLHWQWVIKGKTFIQREHSLPLPWGATGGKMEYKKPSAETRRGGGAASGSWCAQLPPWYNVVRVTAFSEYWNYSLWRGKFELINWICATKILFKNITSA